MFVRGVPLRRQPKVFFETCPLYSRSLCVPVAWENCPREVLSSCISPFLDQRVFRDSDGSIDEPARPFLLDLSFWCVRRFFLSPFGLFRVMAAASKQLPETLAYIRDDFAELVSCGIWTTAVLEKQYPPQTISLLLWRDCDGVPSLDFSSHHSSASIFINPLFLDYLLAFEKLDDWSSIQRRLYAFGRDEIKEIRDSPIGDTIAETLTNPGGAAPLLSPHIRITSITLSHIEDHQPPMSSFVRACQAVCLLTHHLVEHVGQTLLFSYLRQESNEVTMQQLLDIEWSVQRSGSMVYFPPHFVFKEGEEPDPTILASHWASCCFISPSWYNLLSGKYGSRGFTPRPSYPELVTIGPDQRILLSSQNEWIPIGFTVHGRVRLTVDGVKVYLRKFLKVAQHGLREVFQEVYSENIIALRTMGLDGPGPQDVKEDTTRAAVRIRLVQTSSVKGEWLPLTWSPRHLPAGCTHFVVSVSVQTADRDWLHSTGQIIELVSPKKRTVSLQ